MAAPSNVPSSSAPQFNEQSADSPPVVNGAPSDAPKMSLSPAQLRQLAADTSAENAPLSPPPSSTSSNFPNSSNIKRPRKPVTPPNFLSEGDFPSLGSPKSTATPKHVAGSWGAKRPSPVLPTTTNNIATTNGVNGRGYSSTASSSRASTPAPIPRPYVIPGAKNLQSQVVTELVRFNRDQLQNPNAKDFRAVCDKVTKLCGVEPIRSTRSTVSGVVTFSISGKPENVVKARNRLQNEVGIKRVDKIYAPSSVLPYVIGKKGSVLKAIQENSGANVKVPKKEEVDGASVVAAEDDSEDDLVEITIEGVDSAISKAKEELTKIIDEKTSRKTEKLTDIPADFFHLIAGPDDINIQEWEGPADRDIKIRIPNPHHPSSDEYITLTGHRDLVAEVREKMVAKYKQLKSTTTPVTVDVARTKHRFLIGDRGDGIKALLAETGCAVIVPPLNVEAGDKITIRSEPAKLSIGLGKVLECAEVAVVTYDLTSFTGKDEEGISHARNLVRYARRQNMFSKLTSMYDTVNLTVPRPSALMAENPSIIFEIDGRDLSQVHHVETSLHTLIHSLPREKFSSVEIDPCLHGVLIGRKAQGLQFIKDQFNVHCLFEETDPEILLIYEGADSPAKALEGAINHMQTLASATSDIEEQSIPIPRKYHKIIIGPNRTTLNALIGDQSDRATIAKVQVYVGGRSRDPEKQDDVVIVRGPKADVARIVKNINDHVAEAKHNEFITSFVEEFVIPEAYSKNVIGRGGKRIQELRERFGVAIKVDEGKVHIQGVKKNVEEAKKTILQIVEDLKDDTIQRLPIKNEHHGHLIGEKGANVRRLQERYAVRIHFPRREDEEERNSMAEEEKPRSADEIVVRGPSKGVKSAVDELNELLEYRLQHSHTGEIEILARGRQRLLRNGGIISTLRQDPGHVRIDVPSRTNDESDDTVIVIRVEGTDSFVKKAVEEIKSIGDEVRGETTRILTIDPKYHKSLIGPGGKTVQKLITDAGGPEDRSVQARIVRFPRPGEDSDKIVLTGPPAVVNKIAEKFLEYASKETIEVDVPIEKLSRIIGAGGKKRMELEAEYDVIIYVPPTNRSNNRGNEKIKITGRSEQNEKAKNAILDIVKSGDGITVQVPKCLHHRLFNEGRIRNQLRQQFSVYISLDGTEIPPAPSNALNGTTGRIDDEEGIYSWHIAEDSADSADNTVSWKLRGSENNLQKAKDYICAQMASLRDQGDCTGYLNVPAEHHHLIIGRGGQKIGSVRGETGCTIDVPKRGDGGETIVIRGTRDGVTKAKELIIELVENGQHRPNGASPQRRR